MTDRRLYDVDRDGRRAAPVERLADAHVHFRGDTEELESLLDISRKYNVEYLFIICPFGNRDAVGILEKYESMGERIIPLCRINMEDNDPDSIDRAYDAGFWGIKCISPSHSYDNRFYDPLYERAQDKGMPLLFHTGILAKNDQTYSAGSGMSLMRGDTLDTVATRFPELLIQGAHLGCPNITEAVQACVYSPNLVWDTSGGCRHILEKNPALLSAALNHHSELWNSIMWATDISSPFFRPEYADGWPNCYEYFLAYWQVVMSKIDPVPDTEQLDGFFCGNAERWVERIRKLRSKAAGIAGG